MYPYVNMMVALVLLLYSSPVFLDLTAEAASNSRAPAQKQGTPI